MTDQDHLDRINALTRNARQTWFALLAALVFVGITLMGVEHIDFYGVDRATELPLVSVEVPTRYFFIAAPILIAAIYGYFHLYLIRLWDALGSAPARLNGIRLGDAIAPWLVSDAGLTIRAWRREDNCTTPRVLEIPSALLNLLLAWGFGLIVLIFLHALSLPTRSFLISGIAAAAFSVALIAAVASLTAFDRRLRTATKDHLFFAKWRVLDLACCLIIFSFTGVLTWLWSEGPSNWLADLNLTGESIVERPSGWQQYPIAKNDFLKIWCDRNEDDNICFKGQKSNPRFMNEFLLRRHATIEELKRPAWHRSIIKWDDREFENFDGLDFREAKLSNSFLVGANLSKIRLENSNLGDAWMEAAILYQANIVNSDFARAQLPNAVFTQASIAGSLFTGAMLERAIFDGARIIGGDFSGTYLLGVNFSFSSILGAPDNKVSFQHSYLADATFDGAMLRFVDLGNVWLLNENDFRNSFMDQSTFQSFEETWAKEIPCQWVPDEVLNDERFYGKWLGWLVEMPPRDNFSVEELWRSVSPPSFEDVTPIPPPPGCTWKTGPMPGAD